MTIGVKPHMTYEEWEHIAQQCITIEADFEKLLSLISGKLSAKTMDAVHKSRDHFVQKTKMHCFEKDMINQGYTDCGILWNQQR